MSSNRYELFRDASLSGGVLSDEDCRFILDDPSVAILPLLQAAYEVRHKQWGNAVHIHIINNAKNGNCPEDCSYCVQAKTSDTPIADYPIKSDDEIMAEAKHAYESGAFRYCMVFAGRGPTIQRVQKLSALIRQIKETYPIEVCLSPGLLTQEATDMLKGAGLDRLNHNLNTSESYYPEICNTHTFQDRLNTLKAARTSGIELCSGMIAGLGETTNDIILVAKKLRELGTKSIPVNFYMAVEGNRLGEKDTLSPQRCLRILCLFRFLNPTSELRMAAGREMHLRSMQVMGLYPANSLFMDGYLNTKGTGHFQTLQMIRDAGFDVESDHDLDALLANAENHPEQTLSQTDKAILKTVSELRPTR
jgi:biotin synthase